MAKILSIHSYRGGTGKSNLTANLAACLASSGKRVAVVDTDIQSPGIHMLFGLEDTSHLRTLNDYLWERCPVQEAATDVTPPSVREAGGRVWLVPSSVQAGEIAKVLREGYDVGLMNDGMRDLADHLALDYLLIDTHPGLNEETLLSIAISDRPDGVAATRSPGLSGDRRHRGGRAQARGARTGAGAQQGAPERRGRWLCR